VHEKHLIGPVRPVLPRAGSRGLRRADADSPRGPRAELLLLHPEHAILPPHAGQGLKPIPSHKKQDITDAPYVAHRSPASLITICLT